MSTALEVVPLAAFFAWSLYAQNPTKPDLTGTWHLDAQRTRFGHLPRTKDLVLRIEHHEPKIRISTGKNGDVHETLDLTTDGKEYPLTLEGKACTAKAQWFAWQGQRLVVETNCQSVSRGRRLTLGSKGTILTTVLTVKDGSGEKQAYEFFSRE